MLFESLLRIILLTEKAQAPRVTPSGCAHIRNAIYKPTGEQIENKIHPANAGSVPCCYTSILCSSVKCTVVTCRRSFSVIEYTRKFQPVSHKQGLCWSWAPISLFSLRLCEYSCIPKCNLLKFIPEFLPPPPQAFNMATIRDYEYWFGCMTVTCYFDINATEPMFLL
jgi:hypothetical protein